MKRLALSLLATLALAGTAQAEIILTHVLGLSYSPDGKRLMIPSHHGLAVYENGKWSKASGRPRLPPAAGGERGPSTHAKEWLACVRVSAMQQPKAPSWYDRHVLPYVLDFACGLKPVREQREKVVPLARGRVLEIGIGTGLNLAHYDKAKIEKIVGLDPALEMHRLARKRMRAAGLSIDLVGLPAERIPFDAGAFDTVLVTYTLCSIAEPIAALKEMRRVLKPSGSLIFCEHGLAPDPSVQRWQDRLTPLWSRLGGGCHLNRDVPSLLSAAGLRSTDMQAVYLPGPRALTYNYWGTAVADS